MEKFARPIMSCGRYVATLASPLVLLSLAPGIAPFNLSDRALASVLLAVFLDYAATLRRVQLSQVFEKIQRLPASGRHSAAPTRKYINSAS